MSTQQPAMATRLLLDAFDRVHEQIPQILDGLSSDDLRWRVDADANPVGWLIWHLARVQDDHLAGVAGACGQDRAQVYPAWSTRFDLPYDVADIGYGHSSEEVAAFSVPDAALLVGYHDAVHDLTREVLLGLDEDAYDRIVDSSWDPPVTAASRLVSVVNDTTAHVGQAAYVAGLLERRRS